jgi:hypothetical protein
LADLSLVVEWLIRFHRQTETSRLRWDEAAIERWVNQPLAAYAEQQPLSVAEQGLLAAAQERAALLIGAELPLAWRHHDFAPWNIYRAGDRLTVIDWELNRDWESTHAGPAVCDLLYFVVYWNNIANRLYTPEAELAGLGQLFWKGQHGNRLVQAARSTLQEYTTALAIDRRFLPLLLVCLWAEQVVYGAARAQKLGGQAEASRARQKALDIMRYLAAHAPQLFAAHQQPGWDE